MTQCAFKFCQNIFQSADIFEWLLKMINIYVILCYLLVVLNTLVETETLFKRVSCTNHADSLTEAVQTWVSDACPVNIDHYVVLGAKFGDFQRDKKGH